MRERGELAKNIKAAIERLENASVSGIARSLKIAEQQVYPHVRAMLGRGEILQVPGTTMPKLYRVERWDEKVVEKPVATKAVASATIGGLEGAIRDHERAVQRRRDAEVELSEATKAVIETTERRLSFGWEDWSSRTE